MKNLSTNLSHSGFGGRRYDPLNNFLFYKIFGEKGDEVQLLGFINAVLGKSGNNLFTSVEILENKSPCQRFSQCLPPSGRQRA